VPGLKPRLRLLSLASFLPGRLLPTQTVSPPPYSRTVSVSRRVLSVGVTELVLGGPGRSSPREGEVPDEPKPNCITLTELVLGGPSSDPFSVFSGTRKW
jgi:hypothetical protein